MADRLVIALFRHGLTEANEKGAYIGWTDLPLSEKGKKHLSEDDGKYQLVFSSPLKRCKQTAELLFPENETVIIPELKEFNFGDWDGKTYEELKDDVMYQKWLSDPSKEKTPRGESLAEFESRILKGWEKVLKYIVEYRYSKVAIMTHGGVIRQLLTKLSEWPHSFFEWDVPCGSGYKLTWTKDKIRRDHLCISLQGVPIMEKLAGSKKIIN